MSSRSGLPNGSTAAPVQQPDAPSDGSPASDLPATDRTPVEAPVQPPAVPEKEPTPLIGDA